VIGAAGFGRGISWKDEVVVPSGHTMTFKESLHIVTTHLLLKVLVPSWAMGMTAKLRKANLAFEELRVNRYFIKFGNINRLILELITAIHDRDDSRTRKIGKDRAPRSI